MPLSTMSLRPEYTSLLFAHPDPTYRATAARILRGRGWEVYVCQSASEVRRLVRLLTPNVVLLATRLPDESGWLTCDKLVREGLGTRVILMENAPSVADHQFAEFVGAAGLIEEGDLDALPPAGDVERALQAAK